ncbi:uncharacterized protein EI90DRAFT_3057414 [Cantharellus anzutake]|uniref:uncharacterized protein n=1 Tax=Cantharellus anzutake TaxID=1750568 RepID=UPI001903DE5F|nr:uncharacterized protein EI90DRAFT_3057414 [Cantharellus anzutake]KAF8331291.1 hypothetical protein EI90DRAFT_3057414 [Cantharellus anzutake]
MSARLVSSHTQNEQKDPASNRSSVRRYYYIDYPLFCNLVKFGIADMHRVIDEKLRNELADKGYICPNCKKTFAMLDAYQLADPFRGGLFFCDLCGTEVVDNTDGVGMGESGSAAGREDRMQRFNKGTETIQSLLKKTDEIKFPSFDIAQWVHAHNVAAHMAANALPSGAGGALGTSAMGKPGDGLAIAGAHGTGAPHTQKVSVEIIDEKDSEERKKALEAAALATRQQNAMPAWHTHSTVSGEVTALGLKETVQPAPSALSPLMSMEDEEEKKDVKPTFGLATDVDKAEYYSRYYAQLEEKRQQEEVGGEPSVGGLYLPNVASKKRLRDEDEGIETSRGESGGDEGKRGVIVYVAGEPMDLNDVTDDHHDLMTPEEYEAYFQVLAAQ